MEGEKVEDDVEVKDEDVNVQAGNNGEYDEDDNELFVKLELAPELAWISHGVEVHRGSD